MPGNHDAANGTPLTDTTQEPKAETVLAAGERATHDRLRAYLERCRSRLAVVRRLRVFAVGLATVATCALVGTAALAHLVPAESWVLAARVGLYAVVAVTVVWVVLRRVDARQAARWVESRAAAFDGRIATWFDSTRRAEPPALLPKLAADAFGLTKNLPPRRVVSWRLLAAPLGVCLVAAGLLAWSHTAAPDSWRLPAERLWLGEALGDTRPRIVVSPGNTLVQRGADVLVSAQAQGFAADELRLHVLFGSSDRWEQARMLQSAGGAHEFVLVAVAEPVGYFVSADSVNSPRFRLDVADLPVVERLDVTLRFPAWTRLDARTQAHGDVAAVAGTEVDVRVHASAALEDGRVVVGETAHELADGSATFVVRQAGTWHVAVEHLGKTVRISDRFLIELVQDAPPEVEFVFPGHDRAATAIEEVALRFRAEDDFGVDALTLRYAVNGGAWRALEGSASGGRQAAGDHLVAFEALADDDGRSMRPGDVLAFYAEARDHAQSARTALYFVDVRPFDRRYRERQGGGGGGGGGAGGDLELSARQRDIVAATWNLIRDRDGGSPADDEFKDQVDMVAMLQRSLQEQVQTLVARAESRGLAEEDGISPFVAHLTDAAAAMLDAADTLAGGDLDGAVPMERQALNHLLTAEAGLRDVNVSLARRNAGGDAARRSLSELVDLELDPERNRYETAQQPTFGQRAEARDDEWQRLTELARRQEELARRQEREGRALPESRWQLERLEDELAALGERLARQQGQRQSSRNPGAAGQASQGGSDDLREALAEIETARAAVERSLARDEADAQALRSAASALRSGAEHIREDGRQALAEQLRGAERRSDVLLADQERIVARLEALRDETLAASRASSEGRGEGRFRFYDYSLQAEADTKRRMQSDLTALAADLADAKRQLEETAQGAAREIDRALLELSESRLSERLTTAAEYFEAGRPLFLGANEDRVRDALAAFGDRVAAAARQVESAGATRGPAAPTVERVQALRSRLQAAAMDGDNAAVNSIADATARLAGEVFDGSGLADPLARELAAAGAANYRGLGADAANRKHLVRMTLTGLDRIEIALRKVDGVPVQAGQPRGDAYDSQAVARYFRLLSCGDGC